jgi:hypothetical protein
MEHQTIEQLMSARSMLNPVAPIGVGTPAIESLASYFCRLAMSHCISEAELFRVVAEAMQWNFARGYNWYQLNLSGMSDTTGNWVNALSKLTSVPNLDALTLLTWRDVISQSSPSPGSAPRWCPHCLADDRSAGRTPYFRLAWDVGTVPACSKHNIRLVHACPDCGRTNIRQKSSFVVPGWCTSCDAFLGNAKAVETASPGEIWIASQVAEMLTTHGSLVTKPTREGLFRCLHQLIDYLDKGRSTHFCERVGLARGTASRWFQHNEVPTLPAALRIASMTGLALPKLLSGDSAGARQISGEITELELQSPRFNKLAARQIRDWDYIRAQLVAFTQSSEVASVAEAARKLNINARDLYKNAGELTRALGKRSLDLRKSRGDQSRRDTDALIEAIYPEILAKGKAVNLREIMAHIPKENASRCHSVFKRLREVRERRDSAQSE